jgi:hypothetical protein
MLSVGVKRDDKFRSMRKSECDAGLECSALPKIYRMPHHNIGDASPNFRGGVGRSVVNQDDAVAAAYGFTDDARYDALFVISRNDDPRATHAAH